MINKSTHLKDWVLNKVEEIQPQEIVKFNFAGTVVELKTNSVPLKEELLSYYSEFPARLSETTEILVHAIESAPPEVDGDQLTVKNPDPGKKKIKEEFLHTADGRVVRKRLTEMVFAFGEDFHLGIGPCEKNPNQIVNFINNRLIQKSLETGAVLGHAAAVSHKGQALTMAGLSGMGKSTLSLFIMNRGTDYISNDRVMVAQQSGGPRIYGVPKHPRINPGTILHNERLHALLTPENKSRYESMGRDELWELEEKYDGIIDQCYGSNKFVMAGDLKYVVLLDWYRDQEGLDIRKINLQDERKLLRSFMKETGLFYDPLQKVASEKTEDEYIAELQGTEVYALSGGIDFEKATDFCCELLEVDGAP